MSTAQFSNTRLCVKEVVDSPLAVPPKRFQVYHRSGIAKSACMYILSDDSETHMPDFLVPGCELLFRNCFANVVSILHGLFLNFEMRSLTLTRLWLSV